MTKSYSQADVDVTIRVKFCLAGDQFDFEDDDVVNAEQDFREETQDFFDEELAYLNEQPGCSYSFEIVDLNVDIT